VSKTTLVVGIDEAGYGPLLGPLVVSAAAIEVASGVDVDSLWEVLGDAVSRTPRRSGARIALADSKRLFHGRGHRAGMAHLERGVLAALAAAGRSPRTVDDLVGVVAPGLGDGAGLAPWYQPDRRPLPVAADGADLGAAGERLRAFAGRAGVTFLGLHSEVLFEPRFNARVAELENKAAVLFEAVTEVLRRAWSTAGPARIAIVDRQGGRAHYRPLLEAAFADVFVWTREECDTRSAYRLVGDGWEADLRFGVGADSTSLPVALASMTSKYLRELFIERLNDYWGRAVPGLAPTSGYWVDGSRFLAEIETEREARGIPIDALRRAR
jgi:hypothetical protein